MQGWAATELQTAALGDPRRGRRLLQIVEALAASPASSVPRACHSWALTKATYRFWDNHHIAPAAIRAAHTDATRQRSLSHSRILAVQDTTELDFSHHPATSGLGSLSAQAHQGLHVHSTLAISCGGVPLGLLDQHIWARDPDHPPQRDTRRQRPTAQKESQRWLDALHASTAALPESVSVVTMADREADIFDLFAQERRANTELLIRATHNRKITDEHQKYLWATLQQAPLQGTRVLALGRTPLREPREAHLELRWKRVTIEPPRHQVKRTHTTPVALTAVLVTEVTAPEGVKPLKWLLLTTLPVEDVESAWEVVKWYSYRWLVERYHYVLKSGCRVEQLQLESAEQIERALATYTIVAWRLLWLTYQARVSGEQPCSVALEQDEWQALAATHHQQAIVMQQPPSLRTAVRWLAQLGGFLARKGDGEPGVKTLWQGLQRLHDITATWRLARTLPPSPPADPFLGNV